MDSDKAVKIAMCADFVADVDIGSAIVGFDNNNHKERERVTQIVTVSKVEEEEEVVNPAPSIKLWRVTNRRSRSR